MSDRATIDFVETTQATVLRQTNAFAFNPARRLHWLQRLCLRILKALRCQHFEPRTELTRRTIDVEKVLDRVISMHLTLQRLGHEPQILLIGPEDFHALSDQRASDIHVTSFEGQFYLRGIPARAFDPLPSEHEPWQRLSEERHLLRVAVIPWMRGQLLVPVAALERRAR